MVVVVVAGTGVGAGFVGSGLEVGWNRWRRWWNVGHGWTSPWCLVDGEWLRCGFVCGEGWLDCFVFFF